MKTTISSRFLAVITLLMFTSALILAQVPPVDKKAAELKKLEMAVATAKAKVTSNERKLAVADSLIEAGNRLINEAKAENKAIDAEAKKLDKDFDTESKPINKLVNSKDKTEATQAKADLKALNTKYNADVKALKTRSAAALKKANTGDANITKGKTAKANLKDPLKLSKEALVAAQKKYDAASGTPEEKPAKGKKK